MRPLNEMHHQHIFLYQVFIELNKSPTQEETYGTKLSADEELESKTGDISTIIKRAIDTGKVKIETLDIRKFSEDIGFWKLGKKGFCKKINFSIWRTI